MGWDDFETRSEALRLTCEAFRAQRPPHAVLFLGAQGVGKHTLARLCAQSLFCRDGGRLCGECSGCRKFLAGTHPDFYELLPEKDKKTISVSQIEPLWREIRLSAYEGGWRVILADVNQMQPPVQNKLLKTLEEPPEKLVFLLTASSEAAVLPTIRSRCRIVKVLPMEEDRLAELLVRQGAERTRAVWAAAASQGSVGNALELLRDEKKMEKHLRVRELFAGIQGVGDVPAAAMQFKDERGDAELILGELESAFRLALEAKTLGAKTEAQDAWGKVLEKAGTRSLVHLLGAVPEARRLLASNVAMQAVMERLILKYAEEVITWNR